jgi:hypothetical protein
VFCQGCAVSGREHATASSTKTHEDACDLRQDQLVLVPLMPFGTRFPTWAAWVAHCHSIAPLVAALDELDPQHEAPTGDVRLTLIGHVCSQRRSFVVAFEGANAEQTAVAYINRRYAIKDPETGWGDLVFDEPDDEYGEPVSVPDAVHRAMHPRLYDLCQHGLSADTCYGPDHNCSPEEIAQGR